uniref:Metallo-beta-lactamase domain-containing protein n=1 Tax=viral metagenome TaxID=1070528 RepID=A0A6C0ELN8_9ZZZZ
MYSTVQAGNLILTGHCISTHGSVLVVENHKVAFDCGIIPEGMVGKLCSCRMVCITHGHADHISALHMDGHNRIVKSAKVADYVMPSCCVKPWLGIAKGFNVLNGKSSNAYVPFVKGAEDKDEFKLTKHLSVVAHKTIHRVKSLGYTLVETREKLRECFHNFPGKLLGKWKRHGVELSYAIRKPIFSYTGDTTIEGLLAEPDFLNSEVLVTECTFVDDDITVEEAKKRGHIHISELVAHQNKIKGILVLCHFSPRYSKAQVREAVKSQRWKQQPVLLI